MFLFSVPQTAQEGPSPRRRRSLRRCPKARRAKKDRRASRLLISKETRHDNLRGWRMGQETWRGDLWERRWLTARCVCLAWAATESDSPPEDWGAESFATLWSTAAEIGKSHTQLSNEPIRERGCVCVRKANFVDTENQRDTGRLYTPLYYFCMIYFKLKTQTRFAEPSCVLYYVLAFPAVFSFPPFEL